MIVEKTLENLAMWESVCNTDPKWVDYVKFTGLSEINPQYRFKSMTKLFGPLGIGWRYEVVKDYQGKPIEIVEQSRTSGEVYYSVLVAVYVRDPYSGEWTKAGEQYGTGYYVEKSSNGDRDVQEYARKGAMTDALGKIFSHFGIASDVYEGAHDPKKDRDRGNSGDRGSYNRPPSNGQTSQARSSSNAPPLPPAPEKPAAPPAPAFISETRQNWSRDGKPVPILSAEDWSRFHGNIVEDARRAEKELGLGPGVQAVLTSLVKSVNNRHPHVSRVSYNDMAAAIQSWQFIANDLAMECKKHGVAQPQPPQNPPRQDGGGGPSESN